MSHIPPSPQCFPPPFAPAPDFLAAQLQGSPYVYPWAAWGSVMSSIPGYYYPALPQPPPPPHFHPRPAAPAQSGSDYGIIGRGKRALSTLLFGARAADPSRRLGPRNIHDLPNEVLGEIFSLVSETRIDDSKRPSTWHFAGYELGSVCMRWCHIVHTTPGVWPNISITMSVVPYGRDTNIRVQLCGSLQNALSLSRNHPLDITFAMPCVKARGQPHPALAILMSSCHRWRTLTYCDTDSLYDPWERWLRPYKGQASFPLLERVSFKHKNRVLLNLVGSRAPRLRSFSTTCSDWGAKSWAAQTPISTVIDANIPSLCETSKGEVFLESFPNVQTLTLNILGNYTAPAGGYRLPEFYHTLTLMSGLDHESEEELEWSLQRLHAPSVTKLTLGKSPSPAPLSEEVEDIRLQRGDKELSLDLLQPFLWRFGIHLTHLTLADLPISWNTVFALFQSPGYRLDDTVTHLTLRMPVVHHAASGKAQRNDTKSFDDVFTCLCPNWFSNIRHLDIYWPCTRQTNDWEIVSRASWWAQRRRLLSFKLHIVMDRQFSPMAFEALKSAVGNFVKAEIITSQTPHAMDKDSQYFYTSRATEKEERVLVSWREECHISDGPFF